MKIRNFLFLIFVLTVIASMAAYAFNWKFWEKRETQAAERPVSAEAQVPETTADFEILPTMNSLSDAKNQVWVGTFQLVWNDSVNELVKHPIEFVGYKSVMAENLNRQDFTTEDISENSYYKKWGLASPELKSEIEAGIKEKFNETSDILDMFDWNPEPEKYFLYAMLKKDFQYIARFDKLEDAEFKGSEGLVKYFGIDKNSSEALRHTVHVLYYNNPNDFALTLRSKQGDIIYLYRTDDNKPLSGLYTDMTAKTESYRGSRRLSKEDEFKAPNIEFKSEREFPELYNKPIKNSGFIISKAVETVQFKMDEAGVELKSEAAMMQEKAMVANIHNTKPRYFYFNSRYIIFIQEEGKTKPYFAMKIEDAKKLQK